jgi:hypothetical protein
MLIRHLCRGFDAHALPFLERHPAIAAACIIFFIGFLGSIAP